MDYLNLPVLRQSIANLRLYELIAVPLLAKHFPAKTTHTLA